MPDTISATGIVGTPPTVAIVGNGLARLTFRLGSTQRKFNRDGSGWENGETNWYSVVAFRRLAENGGVSLSKGDRVVVSGRLRVNEWERDGRKGTNVELVADSIGHDLTFGTSTFTRNPAPAAGGTELASETSASAGDRPVDAGGWALPGGDHDSGAPDPAQHTAVPDDERSDATADSEAAAHHDSETAAVPVYADAEPPF